MIVDDDYSSLPSSDLLMPSLRPAAPAPAPPAWPPVDSESDMPSSALLFQATRAAAPDAPPPVYGAQSEDEVAERYGGNPVTPILSAAGSSKTLIGAGVAIVALAVLIYSGRRR